MRYDPAYVKIPHPSGDVPAETGVCSDEVVRAYRAVGVDLQREVHEDMSHTFSLYPHKWTWLALSPDANIDPPARAEPHGVLLAQRRNAENYEPGGRLRPWRLSHVGPGRERTAHRDRGRSEIVVERTLHDRPQHRPRSQDGRCLVRLENHRALPLLRTTAESVKPRRGTNGC